MERAGAFRGRYHVLGGTLSALDAIGPEELGIPRLLARVSDEGIREVILALDATVDGQTTAHYIADEIGSAATVTIISTTERSARRSARGRRFDLARRLP